MLFVATRKGAWLFSSDAARKKWQAQWAAFSWADRQSCGSGSPRWPHASGRDQHRTSWPNAAPFDRFRPDLARSRTPARLCQSARRPDRTQRQTYILADAGTLLASRMSGTRAHRHKGCFVLRTEEITGSRLARSMTIRNIVHGWGLSRTGRRMGRRCIPITIDPRDPRHMYIGMSGGGVHKSHDAGRTLGAAGKGSRSR